MRSIIGSAILIGCIVSAVVTAIGNSNVELAKKAMENYEELNFLAEPYMASLAKMHADTDCGKTEIYELMAHAAAAGSSTFDFCGDEIDLNDVIDPIHTQFQSAFGAGNYYLLLEDADSLAFFVSPKGSKLLNIDVVTQMPLPLPGKNVSRAMLVKIGEATSSFEDVT